MEKFINQTPILPSDEAIIDFIHGQLSWALGNGIDSTDVDEIKTSIREFFEEYIKLNNQEKRVDGT